VLVLFFEDYFQTDRLRCIKLNYSPIVIFLKGAHETASIN